MRLFFTLLLSLTLLCSISANAKSPYHPQGECSGLPRLPLETPAGFCVGLLADGFKFPRGIAPLPNGDLLVVDMGSWEKDQGTVWLVKKSAAGYQRSALLKKLDRPNGIVLGPDGRVYIGLVKRVVRFDLGDPTGTLTDVIGGRARITALPGLGRHPLTAMVFDSTGNLYVNVGSASNNCEKSAKGAKNLATRCAETEGSEPVAVIRRYEMQWPEGSVKRWENWAHGLRNSMALAIHPETGALWQAENARDAINAGDARLSDEELPGDELNLIEKNAHYGWPFCYDHNQPSPEFPAKGCTAFKPPVRALPAHAAPLGMLFYNGSVFPPEFRRSLIIGFHGYRKNGHRVVAIATDKNGAPTGKMTDLISGWDAKDSQPMGAPVDVKLGADGALYMSEDRNGTVLRLTYDRPK